MSRYSGAIPATGGSAAKPKEQPAGATMTRDETVHGILEGKIKREDLSITQRDLYREELKKARRY